jgi:hypothetical protein
VPFSIPTRPNRETNAVDCVHSQLALENLALRHQIGVLKRTVGKRRLRLSPVDRGFWAGLSRFWVEWEQALAIVQPTTVIGWYRQGFKRYWTRKSRSGLGGRPSLAREVRLAGSCDHSERAAPAPRPSAVLLLLSRGTLSPIAGWRCARAQGCSGTRVGPGRRAARGRRPPPSLCAGGSVIRARIGFRQRQAPQNSKTAG